MQGQEEGITQREAGQEIVPRRMICVRAAMADSVTSASARGFDSRLSPTQMPSKYPDEGAGRPQPSEQR